MMFSDPRQCWRCGGLHVGKCPERQDAPTQGAMDERLNAFLWRYAKNCDDAVKARRVCNLMTSTKGMY